MQLNTDLSQPAVMRAADTPWQPSPAPGVDRRMLYREGDEVATATSVVRYAPGSRFDEHVHDGGEEFLVLAGTFSDASGDFSAGTYVRNPPGSSHAPWTRQGTTILVSLRQFQRGDTARVVLDTLNSPWSPGQVAGLDVMPLHSYGTEHIALVRWAPGTRFNAHQHWGGEEIYVISGELRDEHGAYPADTWLRNPHSSRHTPWSENGALIYVKVGHLTPRFPTY